MAWADASYGYKKKITLDHTKIGGDETDFPVLISVTDNDLSNPENGGHVESASGYDIVFYNSAEDTLLKHEIERYISVSGTLVYWVKVPSLSSSAPSTYIYIYYGKAGVGADPSSTDTWDSNYKVVHHMNGANAAGCDDSTANGNDVTGDSNTPDYQQTSKIGYGVNFDDNEDVYMADDADFKRGAGSYTVTGWFKTDQNNEVSYIFGKTCDACYYPMYLLIQADSYLRGRVTRSGTVYVDAIASNNAISNGVWYHFALLTNRDTDRLQIYVNGVEVTYSTQDAISGTAYADTEPAMIGNRDPGHVAGFDGIIDEMRYSKGIHRSGNWLLTSYESQNDPAGFTTWGAEEANPGVTGADVYYHDGTNNVELQRDDVSPVQMYNGTSVIGLKLGATNDANASPIHVYDGSTIKAILKMP